MSNKLTRRALSCAVASSALISAIGAFTPAMAQIEEIVVTSQRREQSIQDVPIAVTAFDAAALDRNQIDGVSDLQLHTPNVSFSVTNFNGTNFQIRGIGTNVVAASADAGTGIHLNDAPLRGARIYQTEYYDISRVEVLRGPQGTLFGRNSSAGAVNMVTNRPTDEYEGNLEFEFGNYNHNKVIGMFNVPLGEKLAVRVAGIKTKRDGYTTNIYTGNDIDDRDQFSYRGSVEFNPSENTSLNYMYSYFEEDSSRSRAQKQLCLKDPADPNIALLGCSASGLGSDLPDTRAVAFNLVASAEVAAGLQYAFFDNPLAFGFTTGLLTPFATGSMLADSAAGVTNPKDLRQVNMDFEPTYYTDETIHQFELKHDFENVTLTALSGWHKTNVLSQADYDLGVGNPFGPMLGAAYSMFDDDVTFAAPGVTFADALGTSGLAGLNGDTVLTAAETALVMEHFMGLLTGVDYSGTYSAGLFPIAKPSKDDSGVWGNNVKGFFAPTTSYDESSGDSESFSQEIRLNSDFDGPINYLLGAFYMKAENSGSYYVFQQTLDHVLASLSIAASAGGSFPASVGSVFGGGDPVLNPALQQAGYFRSHTVLSELTSQAVFGELYMDVGEDLTITGGLRYTVDEKKVVDRNPLFATFSCSDASAFPNDPCPTVNTETDEWKELTGRLGFDWSPDLGSTDDTLFYGFISRGYKGGGFNPNFTDDQKALAGADVPTRFDPEFIVSYEVGMKNLMMDGRLQANLTGFYYDYEGMQITNIILNTSVNENVDATVWGLEGEFLLNPSDNWMFNASLSYLNTEIANKGVLDPRDPTGGLSAAEVTLIKDIEITSIGGNCVIIHNAGNADPVTLAGAPTFALPTNHASCLDVKGLIDDGNAIIPSGPYAGEGYEFAFGVPVNIGGNELATSPATTMSLGAQNMRDFGSDMTLITRVDYYWQDDMYGRVFNGPADKIDSWSVWNGSMTLVDNDGDWQLRAFVRNMLDDDPITGQYLASPSTGLFTNAFILEPRLYGLSFKANF